MKKLLQFGFLMGLLVMAYSFTSVENEPADWEKKVKWYTWEEAVEANKTNPKKIMVDIYTGWCHWCKVMDKKTFETDDISAYLNENYYPVKFDAEQKEEIFWNNNTFKFVKAGRKGVHTLAYALLDGKMSYPSIVFLNEKFERVMISSGFKKAPDFKKELTYVAKEVYKTTKLQEYKSAKP